MKLKDLLEVIPKQTEFIVEEYQSDDPRDIVYAFWVCPQRTDIKNSGRDQLDCVLDNEVVAIRSDMDCVEYRRKSYLTIEIRSNLKKES